MSIFKDSSTASLWSWFPQVDSLHVLEIGCGTADLAPVILGIDNVVEYVGVDLDETAIKQAQAHLPSVTLVCGDASRLTNHYAGYFDIVLIRRPDIHASPQNWMRVFAVLSALLKGEGRVVMTTIGASETETAKTWLESAGLTILRTDKSAVDEEPFLIVADQNSANRPQLKLQRIDSFEGEGMYCDPVTGICYFPTEGESDDARQS